MKHKICPCDGLDFMKILVSNALTSEERTNTKFDRDEFVRILKLSELL
jgi:hypothetical protein